MALISLITVGLCSAPKAHDIYLPLREKGEPTGMLCCGGDEKTGDCEAIGSNYEILENGDAIMVSKRYGRAVRVAKSKIGWMSVPGGEYSEAHWCGRVGAVTSPTPDQIDPGMITYCAFIAPGGV